MCFFLCVCQKATRLKWEVLLILPAAGMKGKMVKRKSGISNAEISCLGGGQTSIQRGKDPHHAAAAAESG